MDATTKQIQKLINRALSQSEHARLQDYSCATLRKYLSAEESTRQVFHLGGISMVANAMEHHLERPILQAEAMCTLAEITWAIPNLGIETIQEGCLELAVAAMERHPLHSKVLQMGCGYFRSLSYDKECCAKLEKSKAVLSVVDSIRWNPRKLNVMMEGSMFLQNMLVVSPNATIKTILRSDRRMRKNDDDDNHPELLPTLIATTEKNCNNADLAFSVFGLLSNVAFHPKGLASICNLDCYISTLAMNAVRDNPDSPDVHDVVFALLQNVIRANFPNSCMVGLVQLIFVSMEKYPEEESLQVNACQLLDTILTVLDDGEQAIGQEVKSLLESGRGKQILALANKNFPESCREVLKQLPGN